MQEKSIHIVFQVLNFIHGSSDLALTLLPNECRLLIALASHKGCKGICPSVALLCKDLKLSKSQLLRVLKLLEDKKLISIIKNQGIRNSYSLIIPLSTGVTYDTGVIMEPVSSMTPPPVSPMRRTGVTHDTQLTKNNKVTNKERESRASLALVPLSFSPSQEAKSYANLHRIEIDQELNSFLNKHRGEKTDFNFIQWLEKAVAYRDRQRVTDKKTNEVRSTVLEWGPGHPGWESLHRR